MRHWDQKEHPIARFANYLGQKGYWDAEKEKAWKDSSRKEVCTSILLFKYFKNGSFLAKVIGYF